MAKFWYEKAFVLLLLVVFGGIVFHAPLSVSLGVAFPDYELLVKTWKELLLLAAVILVAVIVTKHGRWREFASDKLLWLITAFAALHLIYSVTLFQGWAATAAGLAIDLRFLLFFCLVYVMVRVFPVYRLWMLRVGIVGALIVVVFATMQLFLPADILRYIGYSSATIAPYMTVDENSNFIRVNSTLRGPNPLGAYAVVVLSLAVAAWVRLKTPAWSSVKVAAAAVLAACGSVALWISYSRSALVAAAVSIGIIGAAVINRRALLRVVLPLAAAALVVGAYVAKDSVFVSTVLLHDTQDTGAAVTSNEQHAESLLSGVQRLGEKPFGEGVGTAGSASLYTSSPATVESQYFFVAHETGIIGLGLFVAIFVIALSRLWRARTDWLAQGVFASGVGLGLIGLLLPVWADDTVSIVWWGLAAIVIGGRYAAGKTKQETARTS
jgi:hypothetical protein